MADINIAVAKSQVEEKGFLDVEIDPTLDLFHEIERLKKEKMPSYLRTTTRNQTYRTLQTTSETALDWRNKRRRRRPT
jgi:hypothetical protein